MCYLCTGTDEKNLKGLRSYSEEVQKIVRNKNSQAPKVQPVWKILVGNFYYLTQYSSLWDLY